MNRKPFDIKSRLTAWEIIKKHNIKNLPVDLNIFIRELDIQLLTYNDYALLTNQTVENIIEAYDNDAFTLLMNGSHHIVHNTDIKSVHRKRWTLMHEISHILLGHIEDGVTLKRSIIKEQLDREADNLTARILAPSCILYLCEVTSAAELSMLCDISLVAGSNRYHHLVELRKKAKFFTCKQEREILPQFLPFITSYLCSKL